MVHVPLGNEYLHRLDLQRSQTVSLNVRTLERAWNKSSVETPVAALGAINISPMPSRFFFVPPSNLLHAHPVPR
jgi:hypothetical protein